MPYRLAIAHRRLIADTACQYEYKRKGWVVGLDCTIPTITSLGGFEPSTYGLEGRCSIQLSYRLICKYPLFKAPAIQRKSG